MEGLRWRANLEFGVVHAKARPVIVVQDRTVYHISQVDRSSLVEDLNAGGVQGDEGQDGKQAEEEKSPGSRGAHGEGASV